MTSPRLRICTYSLKKSRVLKVRGPSDLRELASYPLADQNPLEKQEIAPGGLVQFTYLSR